MRRSSGNGGISDRSSKTSSPLTPVAPTPGAFLPLYVRNNSFRAARHEVKMVKIKSPVGYPRVTVLAGGATMGR